MQHSTNLSKTSKEALIPESRGQCPRHLGTFIYTLIALARGDKYFPEIRHFPDNLGRSCDNTQRNSMKLSECKRL